MPVAADQPLSSRSDLSERIAGGDRDAESALYDRFSMRVFYVALRLLRVREDAEDARAETFLRVLQALRHGKLRDPQALPAFVLETTRNVARERLRERSRVRQIDEGAPEQFTALTVDAPQVDPYARRAIEETIEELRPRDRAFLRMCYYQELDKSEMSQRLGIDEARLRLIKSRALKRFREAYGRLTAN